MGDAHVVVEQVRASTVVVTDGPAGAGEELGSGFFVAPGRVVTCAHVVEAAHGPLHVRWLGGTVAATVHAKTPAPVAGQRLGGDAAVLHVDVADHACVPLLLDDAQVDNRLWAYGITRLRGGSQRPPEAFGSRLKLSAPVGAGVAPGPYLQLDGRVDSGMSGGPVLDLDRLGVIGVVQAHDPGDPPSVAWAVPIADALALGAPEELVELNPGTDASLANLCRVQVALGALPASVISRLTASATMLLFERLTHRVGRVAPPLTDDARREWVARQLFTLTIAELVGALAQVAESESRLAHLLMQIVAPFASLDGERWWWIASDTAASVRAELDLAAPRVVHLATGEDETVQLLLRSASDGAKPEVQMIAAATTAELGVAGLDAAQAGDLAAEIRRVMSYDGEQPLPASLAKDLRQMDVFFQIELGDAPDAEILRALRDLFPGARFVVRRRDLRVPGGADALLLSAVPAIDEANERRVLGLLKKFRDDHVPT